MFEALTEGSVLSRIVFLLDGFFSSLSPARTAVVFFLVLAGDRNGLSFYSYDKICTLLQMSLDQYIESRDGLIEKDLIAFDGTLFQVLDLPSKPDRVCNKKRPPDFKGPIQGDLTWPTKISKCWRKQSLNIYV